MEVYLVIWLVISLIFAAIRAGILEDEGVYTPVVLENPNRYWDDGLTTLGNILLYIIGLLLELIFLPYILLRWIVTKIIFKGVKAALIKET